MRVIAGKYKKRNLKAVPGNHTRPTTDRNKENMFNLIGPYFDGGYCLDLFGGSGALGIEALSRGISYLYTVDMDYQAFLTIKENFENLGLKPPQAQVYKMNCYKALEKLKAQALSFDLVLLDPPYGKGFIPKVMEALIRLELLSHQAVVVVEERSDTVLEESYGPLKRVRLADYGLTSLHIYHWEEAV